MCVCEPGYTGRLCSTRSACPNECSGADRGTCRLLYSPYLYEPPSSSRELDFESSSTSSGGGRSSSDRSGSESDLGSDACVCKDGYWGEDW